MKNLIIVILLGVVSLLSGCVHYQYVVVTPIEITDKRGRMVKTEDNGCQKKMTTHYKHTNIPCEIIAEYRRGCEPHGLKRVEEEHNKNLVRTERHEWYYNGGEAIICYRTSDLRRGKADTVRFRPNPHSKWIIMGLDEWGELEYWRKR